MYHIDGRVGKSLSPLLSPLSGISLRNLGPGNILWGPAACAYEADQCGHIGLL